jgi:hypothetical protein
LKNAEKGREGERGEGRRKGRRLERKLVDTFFYGQM